MRIEQEGNGKNISRRVCFSKQELVSGKMFIRSVNRTLASNEVDVVISISIRDHRGEYLIKGQVQSIQMNEETGSITLELLNPTQFS